MKRLIKKIAYNGKYTNEQIEELKESYESPNNEHKDLNFSDWLTELESLGIVYDMLSTFTSEQMLSILDARDDNDNVKIHDETSGEIAEGKVKDIKDWIKRISKSFDCKFTY